VNKSQTEQTRERKAKQHKPTPPPRETDTKAKTVEKVREYKGPEDTRRLVCHADPWESLLRERERKRLMCFKALYVIMKVISPLIGIFPFFSPFNMSPDRCYFRGCWLTVVWLVCDWCVTEGGQPVRDWFSLGVCCTSDSCWWIGGTYGWGWELCGYFPPRAQM